MAQFGSALALGARCRRFESCRPDHFCGRSSLVEPQPSKLMRRVRFPSPAPNSPAVLTNGRFRFTLQSAWAGTKALDASLARQHRVSGYARSRAGPFCSADALFAFVMSQNHGRVDEKGLFIWLDVTELEPMRWNSVKKTCRWHVFRNSPDRACEGGVGVRAANAGAPPLLPGLKIGTHFLFVFFCFARNEVFVGRDFFEMSII